MKSSKQQAVFQYLPSYAWERVLLFAGTYYRLGKYTQCKFSKLDLLAVCRNWQQDIQRNFPLSIHIISWNINPARCSFLHDFFNIKSITVEVRPPLNLRNFNQLCQCLLRPEKCLLVIEFCYCDISLHNQCFIPPLNHMLENFEATSMTYFADVERWKYRVFVNTVNLKIHCRGGLELYDDTHFINLTSLHLRSCKGEYVAKYLATCPQLQQLTIEFLSSLTKMEPHWNLQSITQVDQDFASLRTLCENCPRLRKLSLNRYRLVHSIKECSNLHELYLRECETPSDVWDEFIASFPNLRILRSSSFTTRSRLCLESFLRNCRLINTLQLQSPWISERFRFEWPNLRHLELRRVEELDCLLGDWRRLEGLSLRSMEITTSCIYRITSQAPRLRELKLEIQICESFDPVCIESDSLEDLHLFGRSNGKHTLLNLSLCPNIRRVFVHFERLDISSQIPFIVSNTLRVLCIYYGDHVKSYRFRQVHCPYLETICLENGHFEDPEFAKQFPILRYVDFDNYCVRNDSTLTNLIAQGIHVSRNKCDCDRMGICTS